MPWTSYLPQSPDRLSTIENWLLLMILTFAILGALCSYMVVQVRGHRAGVEKRLAEDKLLNIQSTITSENKVLREDLEKAKKETAAVREQRKTRTVPIEKQEELIKSLRRMKGKVQIGYFNDPETQAFARKLKDILDQAGWETTEEGMMVFGTVVGLRVEVRDQTKIPPQARFLKESLEIVFTDVPIRTNQSVPPGDVWLTVGNKPAEE